MAFGPLGNNSFIDRANKTLNLMEEPIILEISKRAQKSPAEILLNWSLHRRHIIIPKTSNVSRLAENFNVFNFTLTEDEYNAITKLDQKVRFFDNKVMRGTYFENVPYFD